MEGLILKIVAAISALTALLAPAQTPTMEYITTSLTHEGTTISVEIADTPEKQVLGLSGRKQLEDGSGMLFVYPEEDFHSFWMKDMEFPIDIVWLDSKFQVVHIEENIKPQTYPDTFVSDKPAQYVLEVPAGYVTFHEIMEGDRFENDL